MGLAISADWWNHGRQDPGVESRRVRSTFWFELALPVVAPVDVGRLRGLRVLLAHDHAIHRKLSLLALEKAGCRADSVGTGHEVLEGSVRSLSRRGAPWTRNCRTWTGPTLAAAIRGLPSPPGLPVRVPRPQVVALVDPAGAGSALGILPPRGLMPRWVFPSTRAELGCALLEVAR